MTSVFTASSKIASIIASKHSEGKPLDIEKTIRKVCKDLKISTQPKMSDIIASLPSKYKSLSKILRSKPIRTASGVAVVAVMCKPHRCPHIALTGNVCVYCPGGPDSDFSYSTQSYTGYEPTSMRAIRARYDPKEQVQGRVRQLRAQGHSTEKVELIIMGGTFLSLNKKYKEDFVKNLYDALNFKESESLDEAKKENESAKQRMVGLTIETRPDFCLRTHIQDLLHYGCTRVEIGVQSVYEDVALNTNRGHTVLATRASFCLAKDAGLKVVGHLMPNLPNVDKYRDVAQFREYFHNPGYRSDGLKIYPTLVIRGTGLYELYQSKKFRTYSPEYLIEFLAHVLRQVPPFCRIYRIQRDIPMPLVTAGVENGNLRELVLKRMKEYGYKCRDIRTREAGIQALGNSFVKKASLVRRDYYGNNGWETFLSYEDLENDILIGMCRLRRLDKNTFVRELICDSISGGDGSSSSNSGSIISNSNNNNNISNSGNCCGSNSNSIISNSNNYSIATNTIATNSEKKFPFKKEYQNSVFFKEINNTDCNNNNKKNLSKDCNITIENHENNVSMIRELHIYGTAVPLKVCDSEKFQHQGFGSLLVKEAEKIAREEHFSKKLAVISGVGVRSYYGSLGYKIDGDYMSKILVSDN